MWSQIIGGFCRGKLSVLRPQLWGDPGGDSAVPTHLVALTPSPAKPTPSVCHLASALRGAQVLAASLRARGADSRSSGQQQTLRPTAYTFHNTACRNMEFVHIQGYISFLMYQTANQWYEKENIRVFSTWLATNSK